MADDRYAEALATHVLESASVWIRALEGVPGGEASINWHTLDTATITDVAFETHGPYRVTVIVEPVERWDEVTWETIVPLAPKWREQGPEHRDFPVVSLAGVRARVLSAGIMHWHVDPKSDPRYPVPKETTTVNVRLEVDGQTESKVYNMPPTGKVMLLSGPIGPAVTEILNVFPRTEVIPNA